jgi:hypothetical protein
MLPTLETTHLEISWLKVDALAETSYLMSGGLETFHPEMSWLEIKVAPYIVVHTRDVPFRDVLVEAGALRTSPVSDTQTSMSWLTHQWYMMVTLRVPTSRDMRLKVDPNRLIFAIRWLRDIPSRDA